MNPRKQTRLCSSLRNGSTLQAASAVVGIAKSTMYAWMAKGRVDLAAGADTPHAQLVTAMTDAMNACEDRCVALIAKAGKQPQHWTANAWLLERRDPKRWGKREPIDARPKDDGTDQESAFDWTRLTAAQQRTMRELLALATTTAAPTVTVEPAAPADPEPASTETKP